MEQRQDCLFWYNPKDLTEAQRKDSSKNEMENDEIDLSVEISLDLEVIPTEFAKKAYLGTKLYPLLTKHYPNQAHKLYTNCIKFDINYIQEAICNVNKLTELVTKAQQYQKNNDNKDEESMNVEMADDNNGKKGNKEKNKSNMNDESNDE